MDAAVGSFDPYHKWLGIPPKDQPPNHYRLLGVDLFESDADAIANAADQRMAHVRTFQSGQHSALSQNLLNELAAAKVCLLNAARKAAYDEKLRAASAALEPKVAVVKPVSPIMTVAPVPQGPLDAIEEMVAFQSARPTKRRKTASRQPVVAIGIVVVLIAGLAAVLFSRSKSSTQSATVSRPAVSAAVTKAAEPPATEPRSVSRPASWPLTEKPRTAPAAAPLILNERIRPALEAMPIESPIESTAESTAEPAETEPPTEGDTDAAESPETEPSPQPVETTPISTTKAEPQPKTDEPAIKWGRWVDVLKAVNPAKHSVEGKWTKRGKEIGIVNAGTVSRIVVPYLPAGSYDLTVEFTRLTGSICDIIVPIGDRCCMVCVERDGGGPGMLSGAEFRETINNVKHTVELSVRINRHDNSVVADVRLDGDQFSHWSGPLDTVRMNRGWDLPEPARMALATEGGCSVIFHSMKIREPQRTR